MDAWATREARERGWKAKTVADVAWKLGYAKPYLEHQALADVLPDDIDGMLDELSKALAETTTRQIRNYLHQLFESAVRRHYITFNPVMKPEKRRRAQQKPAQRLTALQARAVLRLADDSFYALAWWLIFTLGLRAGEVCGLRWSDLDLDAATLTIAQQWTDVRGTPHQGTPKTGRARTLAVPRSLCARLALHQQAVTRRAAQGLQKGYWQHNALVFPGRGGRPMHTTSLRHQLKRWTDALKLPPITAHMARHTAATFYRDAGADEQMIGAILGHTPTITGHYAPPGPEAQRRWVEKVYQVMAGGNQPERLTQAVE